MSRVFNFMGFKFIESEPGMANYVFECQLLQSPAQLDATATDGCKADGNLVECEE